MAVYTVPKDVVKDGAWFQPYIHNTPENFQETQIRSYGNFSLDSSRMKLMRRVEKMMGQVIAFYTKKEEEFIKASGLTRDEFHTKIIDIIRNVENNYRNNRATGMANIDKIFAAVQKDKEAIKYFDSITLSKWTQAYVQEMFNPNNPKNKKIKQELRKPSSKMKKFQKDTIMVLKFLESNYVKGLFGNQRTPENMLGAMMQYIMTGSAPNLPTAQEQEKLAKMIQKITQDDIDMLRSMANQQAPITSKGAIRETASVQNASRAGALAKQVGATINEASMVRLVSDAIRSGMRGVIGNLRSELTGKKDKDIDVSDGVATFKFKSTKVDTDVGIDIKFTTKAEDAGVLYKRDYSREMTVASLEPLFQKGALNTITYLLTNMYFMDPEDPHSIIYYEEIMSMVGLLSGLLTLLPAGKEFANFTNPAMVRSVLEKDKRMFVLLNNKLYLMTNFLLSVKDYLFLAKNPYGAGPSLAVLQDSLEAILSSLSSSLFGTETDYLGRKKGPLYEAKRPVIHQIRNSGGGYGDLKPTVRSLIGNSISTWKYLAYTAPLRII